MEMIVGGGFFFERILVGDGGEVWAVGLIREGSRGVSKRARMGNSEVKMMNQRRGGGESLWEMTEEKLGGGFLNESQAPVEEA